jgi:FixJ family two-component response regulator
LSLGRNFSKKQAKVVVLIKGEVTDKEWLALAMKGGAFDFLNDPAENIYTMEDGIPYKSKSDC